MDEKNTQQNNTDQARIFTDVESELRTRFELLPSDLQQAITSSDYQAKLFDIAKKYKITYDKLGQLEMETTMVLLGMTPPDEYRVDLVEQIQLSDTIVDGIVHDVNEEIFKPIRESLMKLYNKEEVEEGEKINVKQTTTQPVETKNDSYREAVSTSSSPAIVEEKKLETQNITPPPAPVVQKPKIPERAPADKVAELKKMVSQAVNKTDPQPTGAPKIGEPLNTSRMSVAEIIKKAGDMKPQLSEGSPKSTPVELNTATEKMVTSMDNGKPYGMHTMPKTVETMAQKEPVVVPEKENGGLLGQIKSIFSEPKKPIDIIVKKEIPTQTGKTENPTAQPKITGDQYREPI